MSCRKVTWRCAGRSSAPTALIRCPASSSCCRSPSAGGPTAAWRSCTCSHRSSKRRTREPEAILAVMPTLAVVGAGPKGIAIAAKARALAAAGLSAPRVVLVDRGTVAGNWSGRQGYTSGLLPLGTPAAKDIGFPYADSWGAASPAVTAAMADFSWQRHLISRGAYADWVDRGRLRPTHRQWSSYLRGVAERAGAEIVAGEVVGLEVDNDRWRLELESGEAIRSDGVVLTGAGPPITVAGQPPEHPRVLDGRNYWLAGRALGEQGAQSVCGVRRRGAPGPVRLRPPAEGPPRFPIAR